MEISLVTAADTYPLRQAILRPGKSLEECMVPGDTDPETFHLGASMHSKVIGVASFIPEAHVALVTDNPYRLRCTAVDQHFRRRGVGMELIRFGLELLIQRGADVLWCNARVEALDFYVRIGFRVYTRVFMVEGIGNHYGMFINVPTD